jgi:hypothetical protein
MKLWILAIILYKNTGLIQSKIEINKAVAVYKKAEDCYLAKNKNIPIFKKQGYSVRAECVLEELR